jgi:hypothetical protein
MNWLWANKEWVFSGAGVAILGLFYGLFFRPRPAGNSGQVSADRNSSVLGSPVASGSNISQIVNIVTAAPSSSPPPTKAYPEKPGPDEIHAQLESLPVFQRKAAKESYVGLKVRWPVTLVDLKELPPTLRWKPEHSHTPGGKIDKRSRNRRGYRHRKFPAFEDQPLRHAAAIIRHNQARRNYRMDL